MKMPNLDGQTLYESMSPKLETARAKFLFVTGDVMGAKTRAFLQESRVPHLAKPFRVEELLEKIHQVLEPAHSAALPRVSPIRKNSATTG
jgi:CheY-like chemotaxis protein